MKKEVKDTIIVELGQKLKEYPHFYLVDLAGLNAEATSKLREACFKKEIKLTVVKNTLLHKAFEASDIDFEPLYGTLKGTTAIMFTTVAKVRRETLGCVARKAVGNYIKRCQQDPGFRQEVEDLAIRLDRYGSNPNPRESK